MVDYKSRLWKIKYFLKNILKGLYYKNNNKYINIGYRIVEVYSKYIYDID